MRASGGGPGGLSDWRDGSQEGDLLRSRQVALPVAFLRTLRGVGSMNSINSEPSGEFLQDRLNKEKHIKHIYLGDS